MTESDSQPRLEPEQVLASELSPALDDYIRVSVERQDDEKAHAEKQNEARTLREEIAGLVIAHLLKLSDNPVEGIAFARGSLERLFQNALRRPDDHATAIMKRVYAQMLERLRESREAPPSH